MPRKTENYSLSSEQEKELVTKWQGRLATAKSNQTQLFTRFRQWYDILYGTINDGDFAPWRSKIFVPKVPAKIWAIVAKFLTIRPGWEVYVRNAEFAQQLAENARKAQDKLEYDFDNQELDDTMRDKMVTCLLDAIVTGQGVAKVSWNVRHFEKKEHYLGEDGKVDMTKDIVYESDIGFNDLEPVSIFNFFISPTAKSIQSAPWVLIKDQKPVYELKQRNKAAGYDFYINLNKIEGGNPSDEFASDKKAITRNTNEQDPVTADKTVKYVNIYECYDNDTKELLTFAEDKTNKSTPWTCIRKQKTPYWHNKLPLVAFYVKRRPHVFWGEGIVELAHRLQNAANDVFNHYMDNWNLSVDGMLIAPADSQIAEFSVEPGGLILYNGEKPQGFKFPEPDPNQLVMVMNEIDKALEAITISSYASGQPNSATDKTQGTATGVTRIMEAANDIIGFMRANYMQSMLQIGRMWLSNNQQFMDRPLTVYATRNNKLEPIKVKPEDMVADLDVRIDDTAVQPLSKIERRDMYLSYVAQLLQLQQGSVAQNQVTMQTGQLTGEQPTPIVKLDFAQAAQNLAKHFGEKAGTNIMVEETVQAPVEQPLEEFAQSQVMPEGAPAEVPVG